MKQVGKMFELPLPNSSKASYKPPWRTLSRPANRHNANVNGGSSLRVVLHRATALVTAEMKMIITTQ